jgi:dUTP pyrophosphatase
VANAPGTIDSDCRAEVQAGLASLSEEAYTIRRGDRIAQMVVAPVTRVAWQPVPSLDETARGVGGFGSTGS